MTVHDCSVPSGTRLGPYEVVSFIAAGGMGEVYEARDTRLNRRVAIKVLPAAYGTDRDRLARFEKEARSASQLAHPNIISVYDVGEEADLPYIVTELLEGRTLATALHERRLSINEAMDIAIQVARGLAAAHEKRIVHRDLKPANIYITTAGHVKILDFGLAKLTEEEWQPGTSEETKSLISRPGVIVGSAAYMSPEQVQGAAADLRSDIFSFGSILYEMVTGRRPFRGNSPIETMSAILRDEPDLDDVACAPELLAIVRRCLAKRPAGRFPSGSELLFALQQVAAAGPAGTHRTPRRTLGAGGRKIGTFATAIAVVLVVTLVVSQSSRSRAAVQNDDGTSLRIGRMERVTTDGRSEDGLVSPDGVFITYQTTLPKTYTPRLRHVASGSDVELIPGREDRLFSTRGFSPDMNFVYFGEFAQTGTGHPGSPLWDSTGLVRVPLLGGIPQPVKPGWFSAVRFAPNGTKVAFLRWDKQPLQTSAVVVSDPYWQRERVIAQRSGSAGFIGQPAWSADSSRVVVPIYERGAKPDNRPIEIDVETGATTRLKLCREIDRAIYIESVRGGSWIVQSGAKSQLWHVSADGSRCHQLTDETMTWQLGGATADGLRVAATGTQTVQNLWRISAGDMEPPIRLTRAINTADGYFGVTVLRDGRAVFSRNASGKVGGRAHLWILDASGNMRQLTNGEADEAQVTSSPDGHTIAYTSFEDDGEKVRMWVMDVDGGDPRELPFAGRPMSFSPDGGSIYCVRRDNTPVKHVTRVMVAGGAPQPAGPEPLSCNAGVNTSPDGTMIFCNHGETLTLLSMAGGEVVRTFKMPPNSRNICWLPDSSAVSFVQTILPETSDVYLAPLRGGALRRIAHVTGELIDDPYAWLPDGRSFICSRAIGVSDVFLLHLESATSSTARTN